MHAKHRHVDMHAFGAWSACRLRIVCAVEYQCLRMPPLRACQVAKHRHACLWSLERDLHIDRGGAYVIDKLSHAHGQSQGQNFETGQSKFDSATVENSYRPSHKQCFSLPGNAWLPKVAPN